MITTILNKLKRLGLYLKFFFEPNDKALRAEAFQAAKTYYASRPLRSVKNPYPRPVDYEHRRNEFVAFQRGYNNNYRHNYATEKLRSFDTR